MRHHLFQAHGAPLRPREPPRLPPPPPEPVRGPERVDELQDLFASLRGAARLERVIDAAVVGLEHGDRGDAFLMLGERHPTSSGDPLRLKVRLRPGGPVAADALLNRDVRMRVRTALRYGFGRGPRIQADALEVLEIGEEPIAAQVRREEVLRQIRADRIPHGPTTWREPQDLRHIVLIASEHGEARRDVDQVLHRYVAAGALDVTFLPALFEGPAAERSLCEALERAAAVHASRAVDVTLIARGGGPVAAYAPLDAEGVVRAALAVPNLVVGIGHAGTPQTAVDAVAARSEATPTAAAILVRDRLQACADQAEHALAELEAAITERVELPARAALARAAREFEEAVDLCLLEAEARLAEAGRGVEHGLMSAIAALSPDGRASGSGAPPAEGMPNPGPAAAAEGTVIALEQTPDGTCPITAAAGLRPDAILTLLLPDGAVIVRVEQVSITH